MRKTLLLTAVLALAACNGKKGSTTPQAGGAAALDAELIGMAASGSPVVKMKIRTDGSGAIVKQAMYHHEDSAIPAAVRELASKTWPDARVVNYESELYAGTGRAYEVEVDAPGGQCELSATADGTLLYQECRIDPSALPAALAAKVDELWPGAKVLEAETKKGPDVDEVTVEVEHGGREYYVRLKPDATVIQRLVRVPAIVEVPLP